MITFLMRPIISHPNNNTILKSFPSAIHQTTIFLSFPNICQLPQECLEILIKVIRVNLMTLWLLDLQNTLMLKTGLKQEETAVHLVEAQEVEEEPKNMEIIT
jgi:hypothetical protein